MPTASTISIADNVPSTRNYVPVNVSGGNASHSDVTTAATPVGRSSFSLKLKPATGSTAMRVDINFALPVELTGADGSVSVKDTLRFQGSWIVPPNATANQRYNFEALVRNLIGHATVKGYVRDGDPEY